MAGIAALAATYILSQFYRTFLAVLTPTLAADIGATKSDLSLASGSWFIAFALMQFAVGVSLDRFGPKRTVSILLGIFAAGGALVFALATAPWMIVLAMVMIGIGCSPVLMASFYIFAKSFSPGGFAVLASWSVGIGMLGNVAGSSPMANAAELFGWRNVMFGLGLVTLVAAFVLYLTIRDPKTDDQTSSDTGFTGYLQLVKIRALWLIFPFMLINYVTAGGIRGLWAGPYAADVFGANALQIGNMTFYMALAMVAGSLVYGPLDTIFRTRKWVVIGGNIICAATCVWLALNPQTSLFTATLAFMVIGVTGSSFAVLMAHARAFFPAHLTGRGVTLMNFFGIGGVGLMQVVTGRIVLASTDPTEPATAYANLFGFYALIIAGALFIYLFSRDMKPEISKPAT